MLDKYIPIPKNCIICNHGVVNLISQDNETNPIIVKCYYYKCNRNKRLRKETIFEFHKHTPPSVLYKIIELWILDELNVFKIKEKLEEIYSINNLNPNLIYSFIDNLRRAILNHIRNIYSFDPLAFKNGNQYIAYDESLFTHNQGQQQWVVGLINTSTNAFRIELIDSRDTNTLKAIISKHVLNGNVIVTEQWKSYTFLNVIDSGYTHIIHNHSRGFFNMELESTSRIESIWGQLKEKIKKLYHSISSKNFLYFLREAEYRLIISKFSRNEKMDNFAILLSVADNGLDNTYLSDDNLYSFDYDTYFEEEKKLLKIKSY